MAYKTTDFDIMRNRITGKYDVTHVASGFPLGDGFETKAQAMQAVLEAVRKNYFQLGPQPIM